MCLTFNVSVYEAKFMKALHAYSKLTSNDLDILLLQRALSTQLQTSQ